MCVFIIVCVSNSNQLFSSILAELTSVEFLELRTAHVPLYFYHHMLDLKPNTILNLILI